MTRRNGLRRLTSGIDRGSNGAAVGLRPAGPRADQDDGPADPTAGRLGTFGGVFAPSILTILGLVLFLRMGYVVGNVGLVGAIGILVMATSVSVLTSISLAAIATNMRVRGGGVYFLISRTLGPAFGGAIGLVLFGAMSISVAFYAIGFGEAASSIAGVDPGTWARPIAAGVVIGLLGLAWLGADIATRLQYLVMALLGVALLSYFVGVIPDIATSRMADNVGAPGGGDGFWIVFAVFFPAITGFTQGVAMSGDLRTPSRSITIGTFAAVGLSTVVYLFVILTLGGRFSLEVLRTDPDVILDAAAISPLVDAGVIAATLSSAIASVLGAPRILQRLGADKLIGPLEYFGVGRGPDDNPRRAIVLTTAIALVTIAGGDLNVVAPIISMFFLVSYGLINYATYYEARTASTSFRPRFRFFDARLSLLGTLLCAGVIVAIDPVAGAVAAGVLVVIFTALRRSSSDARWSDSARAHHATEARRHLQAATSQPWDGRDWRPCSLVFVPRDPVRRHRLLTMATWLEGGVGYTTAVRLVVGAGPLIRRNAARVDQELNEEARQRYPDIFTRVVTAPDLGIATATVMQSFGIGEIRANMAIHGWTDLQPHLSGSGDDHTDALLQSTRFGASTVIAHGPDAGWQRLDGIAASDRTIGVLWTDDRTGQLMTMLAWLVTRHPDWVGSSIVVHVAGDDLEADRVGALLHEARISCLLTSVTADVTGMADALSPADLVFAPLRIRHGHPLGPYEAAIEDFVAPLHLAMLVRVAEDVELVSEPDEGILAQVAEARDRSEVLARRAEELDVEAGQLVVEAEMLRLDLGDLAEATEEQRLHLLDVEAALAAAQRRYADAFARSREASEQLDALRGGAATQTRPRHLDLERRTGAQRPPSLIRKAGSGDDQFEWKALPPAVLSAR